jgi:hypothetical protein
MIMKITISTSDARRMLKQRLQLQLAECSEDKRKFVTAVLDFAIHGIPCHLETAERRTTAPQDKTSQRNVWPLHYLGLSMVAALAAICTFLAFSVLIANTVMKKYFANPPCVMHEHLIV